MVRAGRLDEPITIQALTIGADSMGAPTETWTTVSGAPTWAQYIPVRGMERIEAGKLEAVSPVKLRIRRWSSLTTRHRVLHGSKTYRILGIEDNQRDGDMVLHCDEVT